jgi:hypothetical protein
MRPDLSGVIVIMDRLTWRGEHVIVGIPTAAEIPQSSQKYLMGLSQLTQTNLLTVRFEVEDGQFVGRSKLTAFGDSEFIEDMKVRFADGVLSW